MSCRHWPFTNEAGVFEKSLCSPSGFLLFVWTSSVLIDLITFIKNTMKSYCENKLMGVFFCNLSLLEENGAFLALSSLWTGYYNLEYYRIRNVIYSNKRRSLIKARSHPQNKRCNIPARHSSNACWFSLFSIKPASDVLEGKLGLENYLSSRSFCWPLFVSILNKTYSTVFFGKEENLKHRGAY